MRYDIPSSDLDIKVAMVALGYRWFQREGEVRFIAPEDQGAALIAGWRQSLTQEFKAQDTSDVPYLSRSCDVGRAFKLLDRLSEQRPWRWRVARLYQEIFTDLWTVVLVSKVSGPYQQAQTQAPDLRVAICHVVLRAYEAMDLDEKGGLVNAQQ